MPKEEHASMTKTKVMKNADPKITLGMNFLPQKQMIGPKMKKITAKIHGF